MADHASVIATTKDILMLTEQGVLTVYQRERGVLVKQESYDVADSETWAHPALTQGYLIIKDRDSVSVWRVPQAAP